VDQPERTLGFLLHDVARFLRKRFEQNARELGLTRSQWQVLAHLAQNEGIQQGALADLLELEPITLVRILDRLQAANLIERQPHPKDRRIWLLHLHPDARPLLDQMREIGAATKAEALVGVSEADRERLIEILSTMRSNLLTAISGPADERSASHG
jgi:DNA-binding MarR family transcriptional regulator